MLALPLVCVTASCTTPLSADECNQLLDHYSEALARSQNKDISDDDVERVEREARAKAAASRDFSQCSTKLSRRQWECAMKAPSVDDIERCLL